MNKYSESFEKYKDVPLPEINVEVNLKSRGPNGKIFKIKVLEYKDDKGLVETIHSGYQTWKTLHWIRKNIE